MLSKNNYQERLRKMDDKQERFSIRKFSVGAASVLVGTAILSMQNAQAVHADTATDTEKWGGTTESTSKSDEQTKQNAYTQVVSEDQDKTTKTADTTMEGQDSKVASFSVPKNEGAFASKSADANQDKSESTTDTAETKASDATKSTEDNKTDVAANNNAENKTTNDAVQKSSDNKSAENTATNAQNVENTAETIKAAGDTNADNSTPATSTNQNASVNTTTFNINQSSTAALFSASALSESKVAVSRSSAATNDTQAKNNNYKLVTNASALQQAINSGVSGVNIDRSIDASNVDLAITNTFAIVGINDAAVLNLGQKSLNNSGNLTLQDITINGAVSGSGTVNIKGNVTSNVNANNSLIKGATVTEANAALNSQTGSGNVGTQGTSWASGSNNQNGWTVKGWNYANFSGSKVNVAADANLTINRSAIGDGIHLTDGGNANVSDNATLTVNMNTQNGTDMARYHNAGVFAYTGGSFTTGKNSVVNMNTGIGQAIAIGAGRPYVSDADRFGGYSARSRENGPTLVQLGNSSTFNFTGRDGVILGNNANFISGENSNVHFENKGRGVALDLATNSNIEISKHSNTFFHSMGKTGTSGSYSGYNYIGVNEGGNITIDEYATFRVILEGRGDNPWDDVISLDSQDPNTNAAFTSKTGAIIDIRDDNTNFYAELISFPLGASKSRIDIHDPLLLNLQRYSSGGATTGWMATGGDKINTTSSQYTSNLIYMSGANGEFSVDGTNYVVYQRIKSNGTKQIWLNVNGVSIPMNGFQTKNTTDNNANPDISISGSGLTGGIRANQVNNVAGDPTVGTNAPAYGISTQRASHQIWFPHRTQLEAIGNHTNTIKYVYEDGTPVLDENGNQIVKTQNLNLTRKLTLDITEDKIEEIQQYALSHNADQTLEYIKNAQGVSEDSGWIYTDEKGNVVTNPYATVVSPVKDGYTASIESSNVPGITAGADGTAVTAKLQYKENLVQNGELSNNYKQNGLSAILPDNYETVVVYKKAKEVTSTLKFYDDTTKSYISTVADQTATGKENDDVNFTNGASTVKSLEDQGYKFVNVADGTPDDANATVLSGATFGDVNFGKFGKDGKTFVVHLTHKVVPITPTTPDTDVPAKSKISKEDLTKSATRTIHYVENDQNGAELKDATVQTVNYAGTAYVDVVTGQMVNAKADGKDAQGKTTYVVDTDNKKQPSITWTTDNNGKFSQVTPDANIKKGDDTWTTGVKSVDEKNAPDVATITGKTTNENVYVPYTLSQKTYTGTKETKTVTRTINYLDNETKQPISDAVKQTTTLSRIQIKDEKSNVIGYGTISEDGHSYTLNNDWTIDNNGWIAQVSPDETAKGYKKTPHFEDGKDASTVAADAPNVTNPENKTVDVFYDHDTTPVTPDKPGHGLTHDDLNKDVTRTINYVDTTGAAVNGAPDGKSTYTQTAHFTRTAIVDKVNDKLLGYDINGDGFVDITPDAGDFAWKSTDANLPAVTSKKPSEVGYDNVDTPVVQGTTVAYNTAPINITVTYSKNAQQGAFQIHYIDEDNNNAILHQDTVSGEIGDSVTYSTADQIKNWESKGYVLTKDGYTNQTTINEDNNGKTYIVTFKHGRKNGTTETLVPTETIHFQYADGTKAADDVHGNAGDFKFTRTPIIDTVTGQTVDPGTWNKESYTFDDGQKNVKVINGYVADKATYGNRTATPNDLNVEDTITYRKISNIIPVDENGNQIPGTTPVDYKNDPSDPTKVTPDEESPKVPSGWTISPNQPEGVTPNTTTNTAKVTPVDPTEPTKVVYTRDEEPEDLQYATVKVIYHDDTTNQDLESWNSDNNGVKREVGTDTGYTQADINKVVKGYEARGYYYVTTDGTLPTMIPASDTTIVVHLAHNQIPVGPDTPDKHGVDPDQVKKTYTSTLHYKDSQGKTLSGDQQQTSTWTRTVTVDTVTNQIVNDGKYDTNWTLQDANDKYNNFTVPVIEGYVARKTTDNGAAVTTVVTGQTKVQQNLEDTVVYDKVGKLVPVDPNNKPIPDAPTPSYPNDPTDPTKVKPDQPVPEVPGYTPVDPTPVTPEDPTKDTPVPYTKDPVKAGLTVQYIDQDNNNSVIKSDAVNGNIGDKIDYTTKDSINDLVNKGYILVTDGFTGQAGNDFTTDNNGQIYKVIFKHGTRPVTPENPADPNKPVDPDHPDTPTPSNPNLSKTDLQKTVTRDFTYSFTDGSSHGISEAPQTTTFTGTGTIDLVTGNLVTVDKDGNLVNQRGQITWNKTSDEFANVAAKKIDGYHVVSTANANADGSVDALTVTPNSNDVHVVITYAPDVHADQTVVGKQIVHYVDGDNNNAKLMEDNTNSTFIFTYNGKTDKWNADSHAYDNATAPVINGYVAEKKIYEGQTGTPTDPNKEITIVYHKVGKIIPVGPDGKTPIPNAPTPSYPNDPTDPTKVKPDQPVPEVPGYTPVDPTPVTPEDPTKDTPVPYTKDPVKAGLTVQYIDQDNNNSVIKSDEVNGNIGDKINYTTNDSISDLVNKGYILVTDGFTGQAGDDFTTDNNGQVYKVIFKHGTRPVTPENPADPNKPVDPDHPDTPTPSNPNLSKTDLQKTITRTVEYKYADGTQAHEPVKQELTFTGKGTIDLVTGNLVTVDKDGNVTSQNGKITWNHDSQDFNAVPAIDHTGYYISGISQNNSTANVDGQTGAVGAETVTPNSQNGNIVITLTKNPDVPVAAQGSITYIDDTTGQTIESANFAGNVGQKINYTTADSIKNWEAKGYNLVSNNFKDGEEVFTDGKNAFEVHLVHATTPVTPENPGKPGEPVNPTNPDDPHKYPDNYVPQELTKTVTRDVTYVYADGSQAEAPVHQEVKFTGNGYLDLVTGEYVTVDNSGKITGKGQINWTPENANFDATKAIDTSKYQIIGIKENNTTANVDQTTGVVAGETVTQNSNNSSVVITLANKPAPVVEKGSITVRVHDLTDNVDLPQYGKESGEQEVGTSFAYDKNGVIAELINKGYKLIDSGENIPSEVAKGSRTITILVEHDTVPVTPEKPGKPGEPINPNDPDGPKWPEGTDENSVKRTGTQTIHYEGAGDKTPSDDVQTFDFTKKMVVDKVTGKIIDSGEWNVTSHTFGYKDTPVIDGYHADKRNAGGSVVTSDDLDKKIVVTYKPNGKIIPTDPSGNPIPNVPTPTYPTDPTDPTKVVPDEPVPDIPGMIPSTPTVTPEEPGKDTPVPYNPVVPAKDQAAIVSYVDADNGNAEITNSGNLTGKAGSRINYSTKSTIADLENKGYVLVNDGFPTDASFDNDDNTTQRFVVVLKHGTVPVTPDEPGKPGEPINPNDPDGPKWPEGTDENSVKRTGTQTIHYEGAGDRTPSDDVQTFDFTKKMLVDKVTGKIIDSGEWNVTSHTFGYKDTPVIDGYHTDKRTAGGTVVTPDDLDKKIVVTYKPNGKIIPTDPSGNPIPNVPTPTYPTDPTDPTKVVPDEPVPDIPGMIPSTPTVTPEEPGKDTPVPYNPVVPAKDQIAQVIYRDVQDGANTQLATSGDLSGKAGSEINYSTADTIKELTNKGYVLKNDGFPAGAVFDNDDSKTQTFYVDFVHGQAPVNPDNPHEGVDPSQYEKTVKERVHYVGAGDKTPADNVQTSKWTRTLTIDTVTGNIVENGQYTTDWSIAKGEKTIYDQVNTPVVDGYHADRREVPATAVTQDDIEVTVTYKQNGKIIPTDPTGNPIPNVPTPTYPTDPTDPTKVVPDEPVPDIPGMIPSTPTVTPEEPGKDTPVPYSPVIPAKDQAAVVNYIDADNNNAIITSSGNLTGKSGSRIDYSTKSTIADLENKGYVLVNDGFPVDASFDNDDNTIQIFTVILKHGTVPVTPENPGKPGEPINPNDPDGPKWPEGTDENSVKRTGTQTIHYEGAGDKTPSDEVQTFDFTKKMLVDKVTGKIIDLGEWNVTSHTFGYKDTPVIDGYHADKRTAGGTVVTPDDLNKTVTVKYSQNGKIIPTDPSGNPIPNVPTPTYPTDPTDPTKVVPDEPVPDIPGMIPSTPTITPEEPGKDTPVPYNPVIPAKDQAAIVSYIDADNGSAEITNSGNLTGKSGSRIDYSTKTTIADLLNKGYELVTNGFDPDGNAPNFDSDDNTTQRFVVVLKHGTVPVTPDQPGKPGEPINPNDPDGPKWPEGTDENSVKRTGTQTIHYTGAGDKTPSDDVQTFDFTRKMVVDKVTGKVVDGGSWNVTSHTFGYKDTPVIDGYHADKRTAGGTVVTPDDLNKTVTVNYSQNGKIIPTDPSGNPIPNVPTPTYPTDPTDPTKVVPDQPVPEVPGMTPTTPTVTPEDPGKDTPVPYNPVKDPDKVTTVEGKQIVHFVDGDNGNNPLRDPNTQTHEFKITNGVPDESSHTFTLVDVPVIPGYVAEVKTAGGKTVTPDTPLAEVTVVYHKIGKIVPVDPNGNSIPNVPTPSYTNDPVDPTKVVPNEPVPAIPGKTPDKTSVTPTDPTKDTPVVYKDNEVPATPNVQKAVVNFVDINTGKVITTSGILNGRPGEEINKLFSSSDMLKQLEAAGYEVVYNAFDGDGVTKYFDDDDNTTQQFTIALKLKEKAKTPDPIVPKVSTPAKQPVAKVVDPEEQPVKQNVKVPAPQKSVEQKSNDKKEILPQTGADSNEAATILGAAAAVLGMTSLIGAKRRKKDDK